MTKPLLLALALAAVALPVRADIWLCQGDNGRQSIQDKPCGKGMRQKSHVPETPPRRGSGAPRSASSGKPARTPIAVGLDRNKGALCRLLDAEKRDALLQISGSAAAAPGEDPKDNLVKIEKQRTRVGCDAG